MRDECKKFLEDQYAKPWNTEDFIPLEKIEEWDVPAKYLTYTCLNNYNHSAKTDKFVLGVSCPFCGGQMECEDTEDI